MKQLIIFGVSIFLFMGCRQQPVTNPKDYAAYLRLPGKATPLQAIDQEIALWQSRLAGMPDDMVAQSKIAGLLTRRFRYSGNIPEVHQADSLYRIVNRINHIQTSATWRSLAATCITQHRFRQAQQYVDSALVLGDDRFLTVLMEFDVALELGNRYRAKKALNSLADKKGFEYLIRAAKYKDHAEGNLDAAIVLMEEAYETINSNPALAVWTMANLGDLYGHANRYQQAYQCYLRALATDPACYHALKGIAWLAFSHDRDAIKAKKILHYLQQQHPVPDYDLLLAEIATYEKDTIARQQYQQRFLQATRDTLYGDMYNKYLFRLQVETPASIAQALQLARREVQHRPTPEAYSWLARAYCEQGAVDKAFAIVRSQVENKCFEPDVLYNLGLIYMAGGHKDSAKQYLREALNSAYELGPVQANQLQQLLMSF
jgi:tetratricopeptide (TPR) repeat protein